MTASSVRREKAAPMPLEQAVINMTDRGAMVISPDELPRGQAPASAE